MSYCKKNIGNNIFCCFIAYALVITSFFYHAKLTAVTCSMFVSSSVSESPFTSSDPRGSTHSFSLTNLFYSPSVEYISISEALLNSESGDIICLRNGVYPAIRIENFDGGDESITLQAEHPGKVKLVNRGYSRSGVYIKNSKNIKVKGLIISGGLYGIYTIGSSDLTITNNLIYNVGQEGIIVKSGTAHQKISNFLISDNVISNTGKSISQYGEGIYIGDGNDNYNSIVSDVLISGNVISNTMNEAIDIKINTRNVVIDENILLNTNLKFNGVITVATSDRFGENINTTITNNSIIGVSNRSGYRAIGIAIGHGNTWLKDNIILEAGSHFVGICLFSTFVNDRANTVTLENNYVQTMGSKFIEDCGDGGTGAEALAEVIDHDL